MIWYMISMPLIEHISCYVSYQWFGIQFVANTLKWSIYYGMVSVLKNPWPDLSNRGYIDSKITLEYTTSKNNTHLFPARWAL